MPDSNSGNGNGHLCAETKSHSANPKDQYLKTNGDKANKGSPPPEKELDLTQQMPKIPSEVTLTQPSQLGQVTSNSEVTSFINALTATVDHLASKIEAYEISQLERDQALDIMHSTLFYVTGNLSTTTTPKRTVDSQSYGNLDEFNTTIMVPISIHDDDESTTNPPMRPSQSTTIHGRNQKSNGQQGSFKTMAKVVAHQERKLIFTQGNHFTHLGYPTMMTKNNYGRSSVNLLRTGSIGGNSKYDGLGAAEPIQDFPVNPPFIGHVNSPRPPPSTNISLFGSMMNTMSLDAMLGVPEDKRLLKPTDTNSLTCREQLLHMHLTQKETPWKSSLGLDLLS
ncbi:uncharacterized protein DS421_15g494870 [Arachis hypogaea]|nr:uncharacterized protein DS421_15g494870 [Arachis hypogaea]